MRKDKPVRKAGMGESGDAASVLAALRIVGASLHAISTGSVRWRILAAVGLTIAAKILTVASPLAFAQAVNQAHQGSGALDHHSRSPFDAMMPAYGFLGFALIWAGTRFLGAAFPYIRDAVFAPVSEAAIRHAAVRAFGHVQSLSLDFHYSKRTGALQRIIERGSRAIDFQLRFVFFNIGPTLFELALATVALAVAYGPLFSLTAIGAVVVYAVLTFALSDWRLKFRRSMIENDQEAAGRVVDGLANFETVKAFNAESTETRRYDQALATYAKAAVQATASLSLLNIVQALVMAVGLLAMVLLAGLAAKEGRMGPGDIAAVVLVLVNIYQPLNILGFAYREIKQSAVDMENMQKLLAQKPSIADAPDARSLQVSKAQIAFEQIAFAHDARVQGLSEISFVAQAGQVTALVGPSGSGKSTLLRLLFRFFDPDQGRILIDGQDIAQVTQASLRSCLGLVPQDVVLFNDTIGYNITYGRPDALAEEVRAAAQAAQLLDFIDDLPDGMATRVGERGLKLSGGERQRLGIARVLLRDPQILLLDEATSALDSGTESEVQRAIEMAAQGRTSLVVAHRLSTIARAQQILVLDQGRIVERGDHASLLAANGLYASLWRRQAQEKQEPALVD